MIRFRWSVLLVIAWLVLTVFLFNFSLNSFKAFQLNRKGIEALDRNQYQKAIENFESALSYQPKSGVVKKNLGTAYNDFALSLAGQDKQGQAREYLQKAISLSPEEELFSNNLAQLLTEEAYYYYDQRNYADAQRLLEEAFAYNPDNFDALVLSGDISYYNQRLKEAEDHWRRALESMPDSELLRKKLSRLEGEISRERDFQKLGSYNFEILYEGRQKLYDPYTLQRYLRQAYREIGWDFDYYPDYKIIVLFYPEPQFDEVAQRGLKPWVGGIYDGKVRLPLSGDSTEEDLKKVIRHEYTHLVVSDLTLGNCPVWLNEGLAKYEEQKGIDKKLYHLPEAIEEGKIIPPNELSDVFRSSSDGDRVALAYEQAYSIVSFIIDRFGFYYINRILERLKEEEDFQEALRKEIHLDLEGLQRTWLDSVKR